MLLHPTLHYSKCFIRFLGLLGSKQFYVVECTAIEIPDTQLRNSKARTVAHHKNRVNLAQNFSQQQQENFLTPHHSICSIFTAFPFPSHRVTVIIRSRQGPAKGAYQSGKRSSIKRTVQLIVYESPRTGSDVHGR